MHAHAFLPGLLCSYLTYKSISAEESIGLFLVVTWYLNCTREEEGCHLSQLETYRFIVAISVKFKLCFSFLIEGMWLRVSHCKHCLIQVFYSGALFTLQKYQVNIVSGLLEVVNTLFFPVLYVS